MASMRSLRVALPGALLLVLASRSAHAAEDTAAADVLFADAKRLMEEGKVAEACPKFEASLGASRTLGTLMNLADCLEKVGKVASARRRWEEAVVLAKEKGDDRATFAAERAAALERRAPELTLQITSGPEALVVAIAGEPVAESRYGLPIAVDPGAFEVTVLRGDEVLHRQKIELAEEETVALPLDLGAIAKAHPVASKKPAEPYDPTLRIAGIVTMSVGLAGVATFGVLEAVAFGQRAEADELGGCVDKGDTVVCSPQGYDLVETAGTYAEVGQWIGVGGVTVLAVGVTLFLMAPSEELEPGDEGPEVSFVAPWAAPSGAGLTLGGTF